MALDADNWKLFQICFNCAMKKAKEFLLPCKICNTNKCGGDICNRCAEAIYERYGRTKAKGTGGTFMKKLEVKSLIEA